MPANDFHGRINDLQRAVKEIQSSAWRVTCSPHHNHRDTSEYEVATQLWMDQFLKGAFQFPQTPQTELLLQSAGGVPVLKVRADPSKPIEQIDVYYTQHGQADRKLDTADNAINRFWHYAKARKYDDAWVADLPLVGNDQPLWVYANVVYPLASPVSGAGYFFAKYTAKFFNLSSLMHMASADELKAAGVRATLDPSLQIESFEGDWKKEWFSYKAEDWGRSTHKLYSRRWQAPEGAFLQFEVRAAEPNKMAVGLDQYASEVTVHGGSAWQLVSLSPSDFRNATGKTKNEWLGIKELSLAATITLQEKSDGKVSSMTLGSPWNGTEPEFRNLRWTREIP
jgi:hypothetical protein